MRYRHLFLPFVIFAFLALSPTHAQDQDEEGGTSVGIGMALNESASLARIVRTETRFGTRTAVDPGGFFGNGVNLFVPIRAPGLLIEPEIGYARVDFTFDPDSGDKIERTGSRLTFGSGLFGISSLGEDSRAFFGGRIGVVRTGTTREDGDESDSESKIDFFIGPSIGGEYSLSDHFALGVEGGIYYVNLGEFDEPDSGDLSTSIIQTRGLLFFRAYF